MISILLHTDFEGGQKEYLMPDSWAELTGAQLVQVAGILMSEQDELTTDALLVRALLPISDEVRKKIPATAVMESLVPEVQWLKKACDCAVQKLPVIGKGMRRFYGPEDQLNNLRLIEFDFTERAMAIWHNDRGNLSLLWEFVATIYRPKKWKAYILPDTSGDVRIRFNDNTIAKRARWMQRHLPLSIAYAVLLWYKACREALIELYPLVFQKSIESAEEGTVSNIPSYYAIIRMIAKEGHHGDFEKVEHMFLCNALLEMEEAIMESNNREVALKNQD